MEDGERVHICVNGMNSVTVIFLDFDGVLTSDSYTRKCIIERKDKNMYGMDWFDPQCVEALRRIVEETGAAIVVSSSWRELGLDRIKRLWIDLNMPGELLGTTPEWVLTKREAIQSWLEDNTHGNYVILDDSETGMDNSIRIDPSTGLTAEDAEYVVKKLTKDKENKG